MRGRRGLVLAVTVVVLVGAAGLAAGSGLLGGSSAAVPHYVEESAAAGLQHVYDGELNFYEGGGVAAFDCNADGRPDLFFAGGTNPAGLYVNQSQPGAVLRFEQLPDPVTDLLDVTGAYPLDIDGDGNIDLAVLRYGENVLLRGMGDCRFERANEAWHFDGGNVWSTAFSATWESGSQWPTLAVGNYLDQSSTSYACFDNQLYRPAGQASAFGAAMPLAPGWCPLSMLFSSWDRSGRADLRVSNDRHYYTDQSAGQEQLWRIAPGQPPREYGTADGWQQLRIWGMGIASYDLTGDGYPDYFLTSQGDNKLQTLARGSSEPMYRDIALARGVTATRPYAGDTQLPSTAWDPEFEDVNNDGLIDLFVTKGNIDAQADYAMQDPSDLLLGTPDGTFSESAEQAGLMSFDRARGAALVDLNADGLLDLVSVNRRTNVALWRNVGGGSAEQPQALGNWLAIELRQTGSNLDAIGAWIEVRVGELSMQRELTVGGGHAGGQLGPLHFGLGSADVAQIRVTWPDGSVGDWQAVSANHLHLVERGAPAPSSIR